MAWGTGGTGGGPARAGAAMGGGWKAGGAAAVVAWAAVGITQEVSLVTWLK